MQKTSCLLFFLVSLLAAQSQDLFRITSHDMIGYINKKGETIIPANFHGGNDFSEGLAATRKNGLYGFIDSTGRYVIEPLYDFATQFSEGIALVYKDGRSLFIDKHNRPVLPDVYGQIYLFEKKYAIVHTRSGRMGLIDMKTKKLLVDTLYSRMGYFTNGLSIVEEYKEPEKKGRKQVGVIDMRGKMIVPFGKYVAIHTFSDGIALVEAKNDGPEIAINELGQELFRKDYGENVWIGGSFREGYATISLYKNPQYTYSTNNSYAGLINHKGEIVLNDNSYKVINNFSGGRAFAKKEKGDYFIIDRNFKKQGNDEYDAVAGNQFENGYAIVTVSGDDGIIDTLGHFIVEPGYERILSIDVDNDCFFFSRTNNDVSLYGVADLHNKVIIQPVMESFSQEGFVHGMLPAMVDNRLVYFSRKGDIVWQEPKEEDSTLRRFNTDHMLRGFFYAYSSGQVPSGGWAVSGNAPRKLEVQTPSPINQLFIKIDTAQHVIFSEHYYGYKLCVTNMSNDTIRFNAQDSRLNMKLQAQNKRGEWKDIEYLPSSWCGNSYHKISLEPYACWNFNIPVFTGEIQTRIRAELEYIDPLDPGNAKLIYSNEVNAGINPGQFWNKGNYSPNGIMDPYLD